VSLVATSDVALVVSLVLRFVLSAVSSSCRVASRTLVLALTTRVDLFAGVGADDDDVYFAIDDSQRHCVRLAKPNLELSNTRFRAQGIRPDLMPKFLLHPSIRLLLI
jgi:hypothetical protein